jgi:uncharacterized protein YkwD
VGSNPAGVTISKREVSTISIQASRTAIRALTIVALLVLAACTPSGGLPGGLTARMDQPGASLDRTEALGILNAYRGTTGARPLAADSGLDATAQALATSYATSGKPPSLPGGMVGLRVSAGYANFAETFSGWRNSPPDAAAIANPAATHAGLGVVYDASSSYGIYWVLLLDD